MVKNSLNPSKKSSSKINTNFGKKKVKVLLVGYNGANNTGSEARLHTIIDDLKELLGEKVEIFILHIN